MQRKIESGGLALPNAVKYYQEALLTPCLDWWHFPSGDISLSMEQDDFEWLSYTCSGDIKM